MIASTTDASRKTIVLIGHGMVGHRFCERLVEFDIDKQYRVVTFCEEPRAAYDRVGLTSFFAHRSAYKLMLANLEWYERHGIELHVGDRATSMDRRNRLVRSDRGLEIPYDYVVLATGSLPFVPNVPGVQKQGVFVYRTIEHLQSIIDYRQVSRRAVIIGGGLLGLEAAKAAYDLGLETHVVEFATRLMPRQIDDAGSRILVRKIESLGVKVHLNKATKEIVGDTAVEGVVFGDGTRLDAEMVIISAGVRPRDELAKQAGLVVGERGGVQVNDLLETSDPRIFAIGEVALHSGFVYGLVAPGYDMAEVVAGNLCGKTLEFRGSELSTKLKLMGVDVASFGAIDASPEIAQPLTLEDPFAGVYKKLVFDHDGKRLLGGILIGDASDYGALVAIQKSDKPLPMSPSELIASPARSSGVGGAMLDDSAQVCSCNSVTKGQLCQAIRDHQLTTVDATKQCTKAGTGCGGCLPLVTQLLNAELAAGGQSVNQNLCEHFNFTRQELFEIVKIQEIKTFAALIASHGSGAGCEICKPAIASILASLWNESVTDASHATLQDTNDRFLANLQRGGLYSIVPRVPGGEITPEKLIVLGQVAQKWGLYCKITGGQRIDLFGAQVHQLPEIWEELIQAGFESGHAYAKALRTVKSCVGSAWCRYGVQDSVGLAIRIEQRYRGIRAPHKIKAAVSGCIRECAEAQSKDFGLIATEKGYNLYVCGNGGAKPRHADLFAADLDEPTAIRYLDRFLMYYIHTADRLTRTSVWLDNMPGGLAQLQDVIIRDKLGICAELERRMQRLVDTYRCEWAEAIRDPIRRQRFRQFVNADDTELGIELVTERGQRRPADWLRNGVELSQVTLLGGDTLAVRGDNNSATGTRERGTEKRHGRESLRAAPVADWIRVGAVDDFPVDGGATIKYGQSQIAVFNFASRGEWFACQNMCPHKKAFALSQGIIGAKGEAPKVACPVHKKTFSLITGENLSGENYSIKIFPVNVVGSEVFVLLPPREQLDALFATSLHSVRATPEHSCNGCVSAPPTPLKC